MALSNDTPAVVFFIVSLVCYGIAAGLSFAAGGDKLVGDFTVVQLSAAVSFGIQILAFIPAAIFQTEKFYDLTGSLTYLTLTLGTLFLGDDITTRKIVLSAMVCTWAVRLGMFLFTRVLADKKDGRFDEMKVYPARFFNVWMIQGLWVFLTVLPVLTVNSTSSTKPLGVQDYVGWAVWGLGFLIEVVADHQKRTFNGQPDNKGRFIDVGLWNYSRHPNYFGEITLWVGAFIAASSVFSGAQWVTAISPVFVWFLITRVSGVPMLEQRADEKWGHEAEYQLYKQRTSVLVILPHFKVADPLRSPLSGDHA